MGLGDALLVLAFAASGAALASSALEVATGSARAGRRASWLALAAAGLAGLAFLTLMGHFLARDYSVYSVWAYSDDATPLYLRIAGTWAGAAGSILLWATLIGAAVAGEELWRRRAAARGVEHMGPRAAGVARLVALGVLAVFLFFAVEARPFAPTVDFHFDARVGFFTLQPGQRHLPNPLDYRAEGFGLNPLLVTPFMAVHPPMEFIAYSLTTMPFAFAVAHLATREPRWWSGAIFWGRLAWLFYALALGLGALWAYYVLSFGGYWAWDPVEVGDLLPFLGLTVFLHAADLHRKGRGFPHYAVLAAALAFPLTLFGTFVTRSSYWISAHAFDVGTAAVIQDPAQRLVAIVAAKEQVAAVLTLLLVALGGLAALYLARFAGDALRRRRLLAPPALALLAAWLAVMVLAALDVGAFLRGGFDLAGALGQGNLLLGLALLGLAFVGLPVALMLLSLEDEPRPVEAKALLEADALMAAGTVLLSLGLLVTAAILVVGVNFTIRELEEVFEARLPLVVLPLALVLTMRLSVKALGGKRAALLAGSALAAGALLFLALPPTLRLLGLGVPVLGVALAAALNQLVRAASKGSPAPREARAAGALLLLAGIAGFAMWASPPTSLALGPWTLRVPLALVPLGLGASMASYLLGVAVAQGERFRLAALGSLAAILSVGYGLGAALGLAALLLARRARVQPGAQRSALAALAHVKARLHGTSRWAAHVGILLVWIGYGASGYHAQEEDYDQLAMPLERGVPRAFGDYTLTLLDSEGSDLEGDGTFEEVTALVAVERGGRLLDVARVRFYWVEKESQYRPTEHVLRQPLEDLYVNSDPNNLPAFHTARDGWVVSNQATVFAQGGEGRARSADVDKVAFSVKRLPLVAPLWAGAALLPFAMAVAVATAPPRGSARPAAAAPQPALVPQPAPAPTAPSGATAGKGP